ncbi:MAG: FAD-binding protein, partial [Ralstonia sp.]
CDGEAPGWTRTVVGAGAGLAQQDSFSLAERLADQIGGRAAASRAA